MTSHALIYSCTFMKTIDPILHSASVEIESANKPLQLSWLTHIRVVGQHLFSFPITPHLLIDDDGDDYSERGRQRPRRRHGKGRPAREKTETTILDENTSPRAARIFATLHWAPSESRGSDRGLPIYNQKKHEKSDRKFNGYELMSDDDDDGWVQASRPQRGRNNRFFCPVRFDLFQSTCDQLAGAVGTPCARVMIQST